MTKAVGFLRGFYKTLTEDLRLYMLLCRINDDPIVVRFGLALNRGQLRRWLTYFRDGVAYMADAYGAESLPWDWGLVGGTAKDRWTFSRRAHMGYVPPSDTVHVSAANLAFQARSFDTDVRFMNHKLAPPVSRLRRSYDWRPLRSATTAINSRPLG